MHPTLVRSHALRGLRTAGSFWYVLRFLRNVGILILLQTGGQDDLLTIFSPWEQRVIARCQGHSSFVTAVAFDDLRL